MDSDDTSKDNGDTTSIRARTGHQATTASRSENWTLGHSSARMDNHYKVNTVNVLP